jgi:hypothetical protein
MGSSISLVRDRPEVVRPSKMMQRPRLLNVKGLFPEEDKGVAEAEALAAAAPAAVGSSPSPSRESGVKGCSISLALLLLLLLM